MANIHINWIIRFFFFKSKKFLSYLWEESQKWSQLTIPWCFYHSGTSLTRILIYRISSSHLLRHLTSIIVFCVTRPNLRFYGATTRYYYIRKNNLPNNTFFILFDLFCYDCSSVIQFFSSISQCAKHNITTCTKYFALLCPTDLLSFFGRTLLRSEGITTLNKTYQSHRKLEESSSGLLR